MRLQRSKFKAWLKSKQPGKIVGASRSCLCPVYNFYKEKTGSSVVIYGRGGDYFLDRGDGERRAPAWAERFFADLDAPGLRYVTAREALDILEGRQLAA